MTGTSDREDLVQRSRHLIDQTQVEMSGWIGGLRRNRTGRTLYPSPTTEAGLPARWRLHSTLADVDRSVQWCLVERDAGGWILLYHHLLLEQTAMRWGRESLAAAYETLQRDAARPDGSGEARALADWLRDVLVGLYDPTDPDEAAERMLFALSGNLRTPPRAALSLARAVPA